MEEPRLVQKIKDRELDGWRLVAMYYRICRIQKENGVEIRPYCEAIVSLDVANRKKADVTGNSQTGKIYCVYVWRRKKGYMP